MYLTLGWLVGWLAGWLAGLVGWLVGLKELFFWPGGGVFTF